MADEDVTDKIRLNDYMTSQEEILCNEGNLYLTNKRLIKFFTKNDIPKIEIFHDIDINNLVSIQKVYKNYRYLRYFGLAVLAIGIILFLLMPISLSDILLTLIPLVFIFTGIGSIAGGFYTKETIVFITSAHTKMISGSLSKKFLSNVREVMYYQPKKGDTKKRW
jgi:hypothetical protein